MAVRLVSPPRRIEARSEEAPAWRFHNSDDWSQGTASMASAQAIQASCQTAAARKDDCFQLVAQVTRCRTELDPHPKFAIRSILVRRTKVEQPVPRWS